MKVGAAKRLVIEALLDAGKNTTYTAKEAGSSPSTVRKVRKELTAGKRKKMEAVEAIKRKMGSLYYGKAEKAAAGITDEKLGEASARDLAYISDILHKNARLAFGESTENVLSITAQIRAAGAREMLELRPSKIELANPLVEKKIDIGNGGIKDGAG